MAVALAMAGQLLMAGCVPDVALPARCSQPSVSFEAALTNGRLEPATFDVCRDQEVTIAVAVEQDGILHLHGYDDVLGAMEVRAGQKVDLAFTATHTGQYPIALHTLDGRQELTVGTLVVHDA
jgi:hypothetical protein